MESIGCPRTSRACITGVSTSAEGVVIVITAKIISIAGIFILGICLLGWCVKDFHSGQPEVLAGNVIQLDDQKYKLADVLSVPPHTSCENSGQNYDCGQLAAASLLNTIDGRSVWCREEGAQDDQGLIPARCYVGIRDIAAVQVEEGWAIVRSHIPRYLNEQAKAKAAKRGLWTVTFS
jgi:endonuclease YncB( thermonuclease family)